MIRTQQRDAAFIHDFLPLALADYEFLRYSNERTLKDAFLTGAIEDPNLVYRDIELAHVDEHLEDIDALQKVVEVYSDTLVRRAYLPKLEETRAKYHLLRAARQGDDMGVYEASVRMYGNPRVDLFHYSQRALKARMDLVAATEWGGDDAVRRALETLDPAIGEIPDTVYSFEQIVLPPVRTYEHCDALSAREIRNLYDAAFLEHHITGWRAIVDAPGERTTFNTNQELRTVFIPSDEDMALRKYPLTYERVRAIIAHEVGTHVVRREHGMNSRLALLGVGLAGYLRGEEGIATYVEQILDGTRHFAGGLGYLAVGWAVGLDGTPRSFRDLYTIFYAYFVISAIEHAFAYREDVNTDRITRRAQRQAWARCVRTYRGTSGNTPGACFTKDIVYREGNIAIWELVIRDPSVVSTFSLGKFDPANVEHVALLTELSLLP